MAEFGSPRGFWGFNESSAVLGGFAAWGPLPIAPFVPALLIFHGSLLAPVLFNAVILSFSCYVLSKSLKSDLLPTLFFGLEIIMFLPLGRYVFSCMSEVLFVSLTILFFALGWSETQDHRTAKIVGLCLILIYMSAVRPYFLILGVFIWYAGFVWRERSRFLCLPAMLLGGLIYVVDGKYFRAEYFAGIYIDWVGKAITHGPRLVAREMLETFVTSFKQMLFIMWDSVVSGNKDGALFLTFVILSIMVLINAIVLLFDHRKEENMRKGGGFLLIFFAQAAVLTAILVMYNLFAGNRHLIVFIVTDFIILTFLAGGRTVNAVFCLLILVFCFTARIGSYRIPVEDSAYRAEYAGDVVTMEETLVLADGRSWDNTVIVVDEDLKAASLSNPDYLEVLFSLPAGFAINYCTQEYVLNNLDSLKARYLLTFEGSDCDMIAYFNDHAKETTFRGFNIYRLR